MQKLLLIGALMAAAIGGYFKNIEHEALMRQGSSYAPVYSGSAEEVYDFCVIHNNYVDSSTNYVVVPGFERGNRD